MVKLAEITHVFKIGSTNLVDEKPCFHIKISHDSADASNSQISDQSPNGKGMNAGVYDWSLPIFLPARLIGCPLFFHKVQNRACGVSN